MSKHMIQQIDWNAVEAELETCPYKEEKQMSRKDVSYEKKYKYLLYRIQHALIEMNEAKKHVGRRHLENGLYACTGTLYPTEGIISHEEMTTIKAEIFSSPLSED